MGLTIFLHYAFMPNYIAFYSFIFFNEKIVNGILDQLYCTLSTLKGNKKEYYIVTKNI